MDLNAFRESLAQADPPDGLPLALQALWWDGKDNWDRAHACAQADSGHDGAAVHAYLHRKEPDPANARYWYARANRPVADGTLADEWQSLSREFLGRSL